jgi:hypothetical protein
MRSSGRVKLAERDTDVSNVVLTIAIGKILVSGDKIDGLLAQLDMTSAGEILEV